MPAAYLTTPAGENFDNMWESSQSYNVVFLRCYKDEIAS
jgi:hypothetical protein